MKLINGRKYYIENGSLLITINRIRYRDSNNKYMNVNITITNKAETIFYETIKNAKLYTDKITHWVLLNE